MPLATRVEHAAGVAVATVFAVAGAALLALGTWIYVERSTLLADGVRTTGVIINFKRVGGPSGPETLRETIPVPVVRFTTAAGREVTFLGSVDARPPWAEYASGGKVGVVYDPEQPDRARIDTFAEIWFAPFMLWLIGGAALVTPAFTLWRYRRGAVTPEDPSASRRRSQSR